MVKKYGCCFWEFIGGWIEIIDVKIVLNGIEVYVNVFLQGQVFYNVSFVILDGFGVLKFINMFIEGISMILLECIEIGVMLDWWWGDINGLIVDLEVF